MAEGYVYVLFNPAMPDLVKVGKTARDPRSRAVELSSRTGVPEKFTLAYQEFVGDADAAERAVHAALARFGARPNPNREFFSVPLHEAVSVVQKTLREASFLEAADVHSPTAKGSSLIDELLRRGNEARFGLGEEPSDEREAFRSYRLAADLGSGEAHFILGEAYQLGLGVREDDEKALHHFKKAAKAGKVDAWPVLARIYLYQNPGYQNREDARKCWKKYFRALEGTPGLSLSETFGPNVSSYLRFASDHGIDPGAAVALGPYREYLMLKYTMNTDEDFDYADESDELVAAMRVLLPPWPTGDPSEAAEQLLDRAFDFEAGDEPDFESAMVLRQQAGSLGSGVAMKEIGTMYLLGHGVEASSEWARLYFARAAELGCIAGHAELAGLIPPFGASKQDVRAAEGHWKKFLAALDATAPRPPGWEEEFEMDRYLRFCDQYGRQVIGSAALASYRRRTAED